MRFGSFVTLCLALVAALPAPAASQATPVKIGYVNSAAILEQAPGAQQASQQFEREMQGFEAEVQTMAGELQEMMDQFQRQQTALSAQARQTRQQEIQALRAQYEGRLVELDQEAAARQQELIQPIMDEVTAVIDQIGAEGGYSYIIDVAAGAVLYADSALDLTNEVLQRLEANSGSGGGR